MPRTRDEPPDIDIAPVEDFEAAIRGAFPALSDDSVLELAQVRRMIVYHAKRLNLDPGDAFASKELRDYITIRMRLEDSLGVNAKGAGASTLPSARRG